MSDYGDFCREHREYKKELRAKYGKNCPQCQTQQPKRIPAILLPQQVCKVCGYKNNRSRIN
jgi:hypothetical protein